MTRPEHLLLVRLFRAPIAVLIVGTIAILVLACVR